MAHGVTRVKPAGVTRVKPAGVTRVKSATNRLAAVKKYDTIRSFEKSQQNVFKQKAMQNEETQQKMTAWKAMAAWQRKHIRRNSSDRRNSSETNMPYLFDDSFPSVELHKEACRWIDFSNTPHLLGTESLLDSMIGFLKLPFVYVHWVMKGVSFVNGAAEMRQRLFDVLILEGTVVALLLTISIAALFSAPNDRFASSPTPSPLPANLTSTNASQTATADPFPTPSILYSCYVVCCYMSTFAYLFYISLIVMAVLPVISSKPDCFGEYQVKAYMNQLDWIRGHLNLIGFWCLVLALQMYMFLSFHYYICYACMAMYGVLLVTAVTWGIEMFKCLDPISAVHLRLSRSSETVAEATAMARILLSEVSVETVSPGSSDDLRSGSALVPRTSITVPRTSISSNGRAGMPSLAAVAAAFESNAKSARSPDEGNEKEEKEKEKEETAAKCYSGGRHSIADPAKASAGGADRDLFLQLLQEHRQQNKQLQEQNKKLGQVVQLLQLQLEKDRD